MMFRAPPNGVLRMTRLDAMTAIFDRRSGATHLVAQAVPTILDALRQGEADLATLAARLGTDEHDALAQNLGELVATGLLESV